MSFFHNYLAYATNNEAPEMFHVWGAYATLSAAIGRKVWLPFEDTAIYTNIYVMYVGDAGNGKSWAMQKSKRLLTELGDIPISGSIETPPGMWRFMMGNPNANPPIASPVMKLVKWPDGQLRETHPMTVVANEFVNFISLDDKGWINSLNDIYDEDLFRYRTKNMGEDVLIGPYIVLLGALTTDVAADLQKARIISTGLARRTLFQYGERRWDNPCPKPKFDEGSVKAKAACLAHLRKLQKLSGPFTWPEVVDEFWTNWYVPHLREVPHKSPQVRSWYASKSTQVLKLAMLSALAEEEPTLNLRVAHFELALSYLDVLETSLYRIFGGVGRNEMAMVGVRLLEFITIQPQPISFKQLYGKLWSFLSTKEPKKELQECLDYLVTTNQITEAVVVLNNTADKIYAIPETMKKWVDSRQGPDGPSAPAPV